jgi:GNAT superfamily N-acetyltransferase
MANMRQIITACSSEEAIQAYEIEVQAYTEEAAATLEAFIFRQQHFGAYFFIIRENGAIIGVTNGVRIQNANLAEEGIKQITDSEEDGSYFCVLTVAVMPDYRGKGYGAMLMRKIIEQAKKDRLRGVLLMCELPLIPFYSRLGFTYEKPSLSNHGGISWHEMILNLSRH